ncbi:BPL-N domain-containing protein [Aeoliella sp. ICT_H6.2]|uniref:BPL-N domain-containing protein n=1 Tax=Aeoliella straminimaris TaxID=2954799 RepID=A0A9X2JGK7_9BACT|nr:BPL-N domain-containing protein [Aeoliella straminimaris]
MFPRSIRAARYWCAATLLVLSCWAGCADLLACTTAVISGRATVDGRPILWKNRDCADKPRNEVALLSEGRYRAVAVADAGKRAAAWMGVNEAGLCIENSLSRDLLQGPKPRKGPGNGGFIKQALLTCAKVEDVQRLLEATNKTGRKTRGNFGVIDAAGGAVMFEVGARTYKMFDANDAQIAPDGYIVRTNFATTAHDLPACPAVESVGALTAGKRYVRASELLASCGAGKLDTQTVVQRFTRDLMDDTGAAVPGSLNSDASEMPPAICNRTSISHNKTVSAAVFHGVRPGEDPRLTTMWVMLGDPKLSIAVPCFPTQSVVADPLEGAKGAELCELPRTLYDINRARQPGQIRTQGLADVWQDVLPLEAKHLQRVSAAREEWADSQVDDSQVDALHSELADACYQAMLAEIEQAKLTATEGKLVAYDNAAKSDLARVAIYDHSDGSANGPKNLLRILTQKSGFAAERVTPEQIRSGVLKRFDVLIMPGGSASSQSSHLQDAGLSRVREFVQAGGGYVGICAGSYLATTHYSWSLGILNARVWDRTHWDRGTGTVHLGLTQSGQEALTHPNPAAEVHYAQGPLLVRGLDAELPAYEVLASYQSGIGKRGAVAEVMPHTHAIVRSMHGEGRVICYSPHPEKLDGPNHLIAAGVRWASGTGVQAGGE